MPDMYRVIASDEDGVGASEPLTLAAALAALDAARARLDAAGIARRDEPGTIAAEVHVANSPDPDQPRCWYIARDF